MTKRGFKDVRIEDDYGLDLIVKQSSQTVNLDRAPGSEFLWIGTGKDAQAHLSRVQVARLIEVLVHWLAFNDFPRRGGQ